MRPTDPPEHPSRMCDRPPENTREGLLGKLGEIDELRQEMAGMVDHLPIEDAEELGAAFCSLTDARAEIRAAVDGVFPEDSPPGPRPDPPAPGKALDSEPGLVTAGGLRDLVGRLANNRHVRYWLGYNHGPSGLYPPEGEPALMAFELLDVTEDSPGGPLRAEPARVHERELREMGFARERRGSSAYWVARRAEEDGTPWRPRFGEGS